MSASSKIEWTDATWNPVRGCTKVSPGCKHCYAETFSERFRGVKGHPFEFGFDLRLVPEKLGDPIRWTTPRRIFVNSMSDLFHERVPDEFIDSICKVMLAANWHTFQILTKRSERMASLLKTRLIASAQATHIWWGVSVENRRHGLPRINDLRLAQPSVAFLSIEPLLEDIGRFDLVTGDDFGDGADDVHSRFETLKRDLNSRGVTFEWRRDSKIHDREVRFDNGWVVRIGRGLDIYHKPESWVSVSAADFSLRPCRQTKVDIFKTAICGDPMEIIELNR